MNPLLKLAIGIVGALAGLAVLLVVLAVVGTYVAYFVTAMAVQSPRQSPLVVTCTQLARPGPRSVTLRFDVVNTGRKDATWMNLALFAAGTEGKNLSDWGYVLETHVPARGKASKTVSIAPPHDYRGLTFSNVQCNLINAVFADGSQQSYGAATDVFP